eukprot:SAG31_NODE_27923_length_418_cov_0.818182_2_plen_79_part_01
MSGITGTVPPAKTYFCTESASVTISLHSDTAVESGGFDASVSCAGESDCPDDPSLIAHYEQVQCRMFSVFDEFPRNAQS